MHGWVDVHNARHLARAKSYWRVLGELIAIQLGIPYAEDVTVNIRRLRELSGANWLYDDD